MVNTNSNSLATASGSPTRVDQPRPAVQAEEEATSGPPPAVTSAVQTETEAAPGLPLGTGADNPEPTPSVPGARRVWQSGEPYYPSPHRDGKHWEKVYKKADQFDKEFCSGWNSEIDSLLTFAGLFSAVVTAFTVESYKLLQPDPQDMTNQILLNLTAQLAGGNAAALPSEAFTPSPSSLRINVLWFLSLTFSLTAGLVGILCKQWLRHYQQDISKPPREALYIRQFRYDAFLRCRVIEILSALPVLLGIGLTLFFIGLIEFLRGLNVKVSIPVTVLIGVGFAFLAVTTSTPAFQYVASTQDGPYMYAHPPLFAFKSPQSLAILHLVTWLQSRFSKNLAAAPNWISMELRFFSKHSDAHWTYAECALAWLDETYSHSLDMVRQICFCLQDCQDMESVLPLGVSDTELWSFSEHSGTSATVIKSFFNKNRLKVTMGKEHIWRDIIAIKYLFPTLFEFGHHVSISEHMIRALNASHHQIQSFEDFGWMFSEALFRIPETDRTMLEEVAWQRAILLRNLLSQGRWEDSSAGIVLEVTSVFENLQIFADEDLNSIFNAIRAWVDRDPRHADLPSHCWVALTTVQPELHKFNEIQHSHHPPVRDFMAFLDSRFQVGDGIKYFFNLMWYSKEEEFDSFFKLVYAWIERNPQDIQSLMHCRTLLASIDNQPGSDYQSFQDFDAFLEAQIARNDDVAEQGAIRDS